MKSSIPPIIGARQCRYCEYLPQSGKQLHFLLAALLLMFSTQIGDRRCAATVATGAAARHYYPLEQAAIKGDKKALAELQAAACSGIAKAENDLGNYFCKKKQYAVSLEWYLKAAKQGYSGAEYNAASLYFNGVGTKRDYRQAFIWFHKLARQGDVIAETAVGYQYLTGQGTNKNYTKAFDWSKKAAAQGSADGEQTLAHLYAKGLGTRRDYVQAFIWSRKSALQGNADGEASLAFLYLKPLGMFQMMPRYWWLVRA